MWQRDTFDAGESGGEGGETLGCLGADVRDAEPIGVAEGFPDEEDEGTARLLWAAVVVEDAHLAEHAETGAGVVQAEDGRDGRAYGVMHSHGDGVRGGLAGGSDEGFGPHVGILRQVVGKLQA